MSSWSRVSRGVRVGVQQSALLSFVVLVGCVADEPNVPTLDAGVDAEPRGVEPPPWCSGIPPTPEFGRFGGVPVGGTVDVDSVPALRGALAAAQPGAVIRLANGEYTLEEPLTITGGVTLRGAGSGRTRLQVSPGGMGVLIRTSGVGSPDDCPALPAEPDTAILWGLALSGGDVAIQVEEAGRLVLHDVQVTAFRSALASARSRRVRLSHVEVVDTPRGSVEEVSVPAAIVVRGGGVEADFLTIRRARGTGLLLQEAQVRLQDVRVAGAAFVAIRILGTDGTAATLNSIRIEDVAAQEEIALGVQAVDTALGVRNLVVEGVAPAPLLSGGLLLRRVTGALADVRLYDTARVGIIAEGRTDVSVPVDGAEIVGAESGITLLGGRFELINPQISDGLYGILAVRCGPASECAVAGIADLDPGADVEEPPVIIRGGALEDVEAFGLWVYGESVRVEGTRIARTGGFGLVAQADAVLRLNAVEVWDASGAALAVTERSDAFEVTNCDFQRVHPAVVGEADPRSVQVGVLVADQSAVTLTGSRFSGFGGEAAERGLVSVRSGAVTAAREVRERSRWYEAEGNVAEVGVVDPSFSAFSVAEEASATGECTSAVCVRNNVVDALPIPDGVDFRPMPSAIIPAPTVTGSEKLPGP